MKTSPLGINLIKKYESCKLDAYLCPAGIWTIGWGHTAGVYAGMHISADTADELLAQDVAAQEKMLNAILPCPVNQHQYDALISLSFNMKGGAAALPTLAPKLWAKLSDNIPPGQDEANQFLDIDHALVNGHLEELPGLKARRIAESKLFLS